MTDLGGWRLFGESGGDGEAVEGGVRSSWFMRDFHRFAVGNRRGPLDELVAAGPRNQLDCKAGWDQLLPVGLECSSVVA